MADAPVLPPVTAETVEAHMTSWHGCVPAWCFQQSNQPTAGEHHRHHHQAQPAGAFGHTHSPPAADEGTTT